MSDKCRSTGDSKTNDTATYQFTSLNRRLGQRDIVNRCKDHLGLFKAELEKAGLAGGLKGIVARATW